MLLPKIVSAVYRQVGRDAGRKRVDVVNEWTASFSTCRVSGFYSNASPVFFVDSNSQFKQKQTRRHSQTQINKDK